MHTVDPNDLAAQLAWLRLGGGLDRNAPAAPSLAQSGASFGDQRSSLGDHRTSLGDHRTSLGDHRTSWGDQTLDPQTASYLAQLAQQQQQQQQPSPVYEEEQRYSGERASQPDHQEPQPQHHALPHDRQVWLRALRPCVLVHVS